MDNATKTLLLVLVMALVTYLIRMIPFVLFRKPIKSRFIQSFLFYVPYAVLSAMTFPAIFSSTDSCISAIVGTAVAMLLSYFEKSLLTVAVFAAVSVYATEFIMHFMK